MTINELYTELRYGLPARLMSQEVKFVDRGTGAEYEILEVKYDAEKKILLLRG